MKTVTICGSMRFAGEMQKIALKLETDQGWNVLQCTYDTEGVNLLPEQMARIVKAHYRKIELSEAIYVLDIGGYIGESVRQEIEYAKGQGKEVIYHSQFSQGDRQTVV